MEKQKRSCLIVLLLVVLTVSCMMFRQRLAVENAVQRLKQIRQAQVKHLELETVYGNLEDLHMAHLLADELADGHDQGYFFTIVKSADGYIASATPDGSDPDEIGTSFFLDQTGVIRASFVRSQPAGPKNDPIYKQD